MSGKNKPLSLAERRVARLAKQVSPVPKTQVKETLPEETRPPEVTGEKVEDVGPHIIAMLESPSEDAMPRKDVEEMFNSHELKVVWANEDHSWNDFQDATVLVTVKRRVDDALLATLPRLRLVAVAFTGYDHVDLEACKRRGVAVANVPGYSTDGAAELCFGLIFSLLRHIPMAHQHVRSGKWTWPPGNELCGRRFGIIGTGEIGLRVAEISKAFRVSKIIGFDPIRNERFVAIGGEYVQSLATIFLHSDVIIIACNLTPSTKGMVNRRMLKLLRPDSILINCARGAIIDQATMTEMLTEGRFRAGLDVYEGLEGEELPPDHPLRLVPESNLVSVPHLAYKCHEALLRRQELTLENILAFLAESPQNIVC